uniref:Beta-galactosidase n=1 Tax=Kalanchoe fedtschenkoi TaxID=63787 RepID=A0A7N0RH82_KALFE
MAKRHRSRAPNFIALPLLIAGFAFFPGVSQARHGKENAAGRFEIADDMFWKDGEPYRIIGGDLHYFRVLPEYWEDRLLRAKALGLNAIQTYVPWNLHEPKPGEFNFEGVANIKLFLSICQKLGLLVLLRPGPYICGEWDLGGFPAWLLAVEPAPRLRSSDPSFLNPVTKWWDILLPTVAPFLYENGGPIVMVQIENEFGSYGDDQAYLHKLVALARGHLGKNIILYTTDGGSRELLVRGTIRGNVVFSAVDFSTGEDPGPIFELQKEFNAPGKSPALCTEFYTGWLTHWGETMAKTDGDYVAARVENVLSRNASIVLYMAHGGTNFGFYSGANTGANESDFQPDLTSYDYDAPISESGDVDSVKYQAIRRVIQKYIAVSILPTPSNNKKVGYGLVKMQKTTAFFDMIHGMDVVESLDPMPMESVGQMFGFLLYASGYVSKKKGNLLRVPKVHDRAQVFISCPETGEKQSYTGTIERWSNQPLRLPYWDCDSNVSLSILVENMGRVNYGSYIFDKKGILSSVFIDDNVLNTWKMHLMPLDNLHEVHKTETTVKDSFSRKLDAVNNENGTTTSGEPAFYIGYFTARKKHDTYISFRGWGKGLAFVNEYNIGRYWPVKYHAP